MLETNALGNAKYRDSKNKRKPLRRKFFRYLNKITFFHFENTFITLSTLVFRKYPNTSNFRIISYKCPTIRANKDSRISGTVPRVNAVAPAQECPCDFPLMAYPFSASKKWLLNYALNKKGTACCSVPYSNATHMDIYKCCLLY